MSPGVGVKRQLSARGGNWLCAPRLRWKRQWQRRSPTGPEAPIMCWRSMRARWRALAPVTGLERGAGDSTFLALE